jgi:hypothetical protein
LEFYDSEEELPLAVAMQSGGLNTLLIYKFENGRFEELKMVNKYHKKKICDVFVCGKKIWSVDEGGDLNKMMIKAG